jgi:hypothetical protein
MKRISFCAVLLLMLSLLAGCSLVTLDKAIETNDVQSSYDAGDEPISDELDLNKRYANLIGSHKSEGQEYMAGAFEYESDPNDSRSTEEKIYDMGNKIEFFGEVVIKRVINNSRAIFVFLLLLAMLSYVFFRHDKARQKTAVKFIIVVTIFIVVFSFVSDF